MGKFNRRMRRNRAGGIGSNRFLPGDTSRSGGAGRKRPARAVYFYFVERGRGHLGAPQDERRQQREFGRRLVGRRRSGFGFNPRAGLDGRGRFKSPSEQKEQR